jgi:outer membrane protein insertion porin family
MTVFKRYLGPILLAISLFTTVFGLTAPASAQSIIVQGATRGDEAAIIAYFTGADQASIDKGVRDLSATGLYKKVSAKLVGGQVVVTVVEGQLVLNRVAFEGNSKLKSDQLQVEVQSQDHHIYSESVASGDVQRIKDAYKKLGRANVQVATRLVSLPNGRADLVFTIDEGDKTGIREIKFVGNNVYSGYRLRGLMQSTEMNFLSFLKTSDVYQPDAIASDEEAIRKYYMKHGYADFRITGTDVQYQAGDSAGYIITISMDEGAQYHVSSVKVDSHIANVDPAALQRLVKVGEGDVYNATAVEDSVYNMTRDVARQGYAFSEVRPHGTRDNAAHTIALGFTVDDGPKVYIERMEIAGNTRTREYVIRREFDIGEGDPYNHALIEKGERRLNNLGYFKSVHISNRPGSSPDRVIVVVEVEDQATGSISLSGGYSTTNGFLAEVSYTENNFLGRGQYVKVSVSEGQYSKGWTGSFTEPYFLDQRIAAGFDIYHHQQDQTSYQLYQDWTTGGTLRLGFPITDELVFQPSYSLYATQIKIPNTKSQPYNDCSVPIPGVTPGTVGAPPIDANNNCLTNGEASLAIKQAAAQGQTFTSMLSYSLSYNSLDSNKQPSTGLYATFHQDFAGLGGASKFLRETFDARYYYPISDDFTGLIRGQGGQINAWGGTPLRIIDNFNLGPTLVRGFAPGGFGPFDVTNPASVQALGGTTYFGGTAEIQFPLFGLPKEIGLRGAVFADAGTLFGYRSGTNFSPLLGLPPNSPCTNPAVTFTQSNCVTVNDDKKIRSSIGASLLWASPLGPIRIDYAYAITKGKYDQTQQFNFSGGASF